MSGRLRRLADEVRALEARLRLGGGPDKIEKQHKQGKLTARERVERLADPGTPFLEIGLLVAYDRYQGQAPGAGVITGIAMVDGREVVVVANDATVKAGSWWPETITKILRAQEVAMRCRIPIIYLVDSAGVNLPYQGGVFPGQFGAARIFYYNSIMRRYLRVPQIAMTHSASTSCASWFRGCRSRYIARPERTGRRPSRPPRCTTSCRRIIACRTTCMPCSRRFSTTVRSTNSSRTSQRR